MRSRLPGAVALAFLLSACSPGSPGGGAEVNPGPGPGNGERDYGPLDPNPRGPGAIAPPTYRPMVELLNRGDDREQTLRASVPFPWGQVPDPNEWSVDSQPTAWHVLQRWPDDSVRVAQAQWNMALTAGGQHQFSVVETPGGLTGPFSPHTVFAAGLPEFGAEVRDTFGVVYRTHWQETAEVLQATALVRVRRHRGYHLPVSAAGIGRDYLTSTFYVTEFRDQPVALVDWIIGNDYLGADDPAGSTDANLYPLGGIDVRSAQFLVRGTDLVIPYRPDTESIGAPVSLADGFTAYPALADTYLGDGQTRRYRFLLLRDDSNVTTAARAAARATAGQMMAEPLRPLASHDSWRATHAIGLLGGPSTAPADTVLRVVQEYDLWNILPHFGTFGSRGDPLATGQTGTPRNHPISPELAHAVQSGDTRLLEILEQKAWTQAMRPYHLYGLRVTDSDGLLLWDGVPIYPGSRDLSQESLGRRALLDNDPYQAYRTLITGRAHGFEHFDLEHWSSDLLFDYWTISGDEWARHEVRQLGESLRSMMRPWGTLAVPMQAPRAEGWSVQGLVQAFLATGDLRFRNVALDRLHDIIDEQRERLHPSCAMQIIGSSPRTGFPNPHEFYMPWQHGAVLYGYLAGYKFFGDPLFLERCADAAKSVEYGWVDDYQDPILGFVDEGLRFYVPTSFAGNSVAPFYFDGSVGVQFGDSPLGGAHVTLAGGLLLLAETTADVVVQNRATTYGTHLLQLPIDDDDRWSKWFSALPVSYDGL